MSWRIENGDALATLQGLEPSSIQCCVTSPPYWGLRDYGADGQLGLEETPEKYVAGMVEVFREVRRVLRDDGTLWLNLGDSYAGSWGNQGRKPERGIQRAINGDMKTPVHDGRYPSKSSNTGTIPEGSGLKPKDLCGIPWRVAFALQADGWYLRSDIIWHKPNPMPESVTDRPTKAHEYLFLMTKSARYFYDADAIREPHSRLWDESNGAPGKTGYQDHTPISGGTPMTSLPNPKGRNRRTIWTVSTRPYPGAHFAVMPPDLVEPCIKAGTKMGDLVLDPFSGAGTVGVVATRLKRSYVGIELNPEYAAMSRRRIESDAPLFNRAGASHESNH